MAEEEKLPELSPVEPEQPKEEKKKKDGKKKAGPVWEDDNSLDASEMDENTGIPDGKTCPACKHNYVGGEKFCTYCGAQAVKVEVCTTPKEETAGRKKEKGAKPKPMPMIELEDEEPEEVTFDVQCYACQTIISVTADKAPITIKCQKCQAECLIEQLPEPTHEHKKPIQTVKPPKKKCPHCGGKARYQKLHFKWFCDNCRRWI